MPRYANRAVPVSALNVDADVYLFDLHSASRIVSVVALTCLLMSCSLVTCFQLLVFRCADNMYKALHSCLELHAGCAKTASPSSANCLTPCQSVRPYKLPDKLSASVDAGNFDVRIVGGAKGQGQCRGCLAGMGRAPCEFGQLRDEAMPHEVPVVTQGLVGAGVSELSACCTHFTTDTLIHCRFYLLCIYCVYIRTAGFPTAFRLPIHAYCRWHERCTTHA